MGHLHETRYPGESAAYREARDALLVAEMDHRRRQEDIAAMRRALPPGGAVKEDYVFDEGAATGTRLSDLFDTGKDSLFIYGFMYAPGAEQPCPACTSLLDGLNGSAPHIRDRMNFAVVAKAPIGEIRGWALTRGWGNLRLLSSGGNSYNTDYHAETPDGAQLPAFNVFRRTAEGIRHMYGSELFFAPAEDGQHPRHADALWPVWNMFDLIPEGRGTDWFPKISYG